MFSRLSLLDQVLQADVASGVSKVDLPQIQIHQVAHWTLNACDSGSTQHTIRGWARGGHEKPRATRNTKTSFVPGFFSTDCRISPHVCKRAENAWKILTNEFSQWLCFVLSSCWPREDLGSLLPFGMMLRELCTNDCWAHTASSWAQVWHCHNLQLYQMQHSLTRFPCMHLLLRRPFPPTRS